jgi:hypothetical protein
MYLISLRIFPFTPNFLLNLVSPIIGIPFFHFLLSVLFGNSDVIIACLLLTFVGLLPYNLITTKAGGLLGSLSSLHAVFDKTNIAQLAMLALVAAIPTLFRSRFQSYDILSDDSRRKRS